MNQRRVVQIPDDETSFPVFVDAADDNVPLSFEAQVIEQVVFETLERNLYVKVPAHLPVRVGQTVRIVLS